MDLAKVLDLNNKIKALRAEEKELQKQMKDLVREDFIAIPKTDDRELWEDYIFTMDDLFHCKKYLYTMFEEKETK